MVNTGAALTIDPRLFLIGVSAYELLGSLIFGPRVLSGRVKAEVFANLSAPFLTFGPSTRKPGS
jgi:hypothetical protein